MKSGERLIKEALNQSEIGDTIISEQKLNYQSRGSFESCKGGVEDLSLAGGRRPQNTTGKKTKNFHSSVITKPHLKIPLNTRFTTNSKPLLGEQ